MRNVPVKQIKVLILVCLCGLLLGFSKKETGNTKSSKPNFLVLISDDQRWDQVSYPGNQIIPELKTPNLDNLAAHGVYFTNAFATTPICAVSRASIMTGRYASSHGMNHFNTPLEKDVIAQTYPALLKKAGYRTGILGKWGMGMAGTEEIFDVINAWYNQGVYFHETDSGRIHNSEWLAAKAGDFFASGIPGQPFCLTVCYKSPHHPYQPDVRDSMLFDDVYIPHRPSDTPEAYAAMPSHIMEGSLNRWCYFDERKDEETRNDFEKNFLRCVMSLDRSVGKIMKSLREYNLDENTIVIFLSDNGYLWGEHGLGGKWLLYEESIRTPIIIKWPGMPKKQKGKSLQQLALNIDIAPTILEMAGIEAPGVMNGKSLMQVINHPESDFRSDFFMEHVGIIKVDYPIPDCYGIRTEDWKYIRYVNADPEAEEMYELGTDPLEMNNLIDNENYITNKIDLKARLEKYFDEFRQEKIISLWSFDDDIPGFTIDKHQNKQDSLYGKYEYVQGVQGKAIKLDGFRTFAKRRGMDQQGLIDEFTIEAWIAPAMYPWSFCPVFDCSDQSRRGFSFGIDHLGRVGFRIGAGSSWYEVNSDISVPLREWTHIAATYKSDDQIIIYINGDNAASLNIDGTYIPSRSAHSSATIGRNLNSETWNEFQLTTPDTYFFLDGLLDEICLSSKARTPLEIKDYIAGLGELSTPVLSERGNFPTGPVGTGTFGAYYTKLDYYKEWDEMWRVGDKPDVYVRFDGSPVQLVFWRGTSFVPCWVSENDIWYTNEWLETWGSDVVSCAEPIMDRHCRYSHVRIIENSDARTVIHWRYALSDAFYDFAAVSDDGRGEWCDEYHIIYPDHVGVRKMELHYSRPERKHDWVEQIVLTPPGIFPDDIIENEPVTLVNMRGEKKDYLWHDKLEKEMPEPKGANISYVNLKSEYKPFFIVPPGPVKTVEGEWDSPFFRTYAANMAMNGYSPNPAPTLYGWWNHWPVAQIPGDGRWIVTPDRPGHFNLTTFVQWNDLIKTERTRTRIMLQGMTNEAAGELVPLAKSWLNPPEMLITSGGFEGGIYDPAERAYSIEKTGGNSASLEITIKGSEESPIINPAIIIKNWGNDKAGVLIDGKAVHQEDAVRQGIRATPYGDDLILWFRLKSTKNIDISLSSKIGN